MYRVIVGYQPVECPDRETLSKWLAEGRIHDGSQVMIEAGGRWTTAGDIVRGGRLSATGMRPVSAEDAAAGRVTPRTLAAVKSSEGGSGVRRTPRTVANVPSSSPDAPAARRTTSGAMRRIDPNAADRARWGVFVAGAITDCPDIDTLRKWYADGRLRADTPVFDRAENRWTPAKDLLGAAEGGALPAAAAAADEWHEHPAVIMAALFLFPPAGLFLLFNRPERPGFLGSLRQRIAVAVAAIGAGALFFLQFWR